LAQGSQSCLLSQASLKPLLWQRFFFDPNKAVLFAALLGKITRVNVQELVGI
jgi:hypothetical protein